MFASIVMLLWGLVSLPFSILLTILKLILSEKEERDVKVVETMVTRNGLKGVETTHTIRRSYNS